MFIIKMEKLEQENAENTEFCVWQTSIMHQLSETEF